jgi:hypothetical protein
MDPGRAAAADGEDGGGVIVFEEVESAKWILDINMSRDLER